ncbi:MAG: TonB-dependent receptor [Bacteroidales bacterium]
MKRFVTTLLIILSFISVMTAQNTSITISGTVVGEDDQALIGATIMEKNTKNATITQPDGSYSLRVNDPQKAILVYSYLGMEAQEIPVKGRKRIDVVMKENSQMLNEVVAIGYGSMQRKDLTGSVSSVTAKNIEDIPVTSAIESLKGKVPGVVITSASAAQEAEIYVRVRGGISVTQDNSPLYIIDGVPQENGLSQLNPRDIETIDVLKDAASTAIYGARGANGVILVTTKSGKVGQCHLSYDTYWSFRKMIRTIDVCSPLEFVNYEYERVGASEEFIKTYGEFKDFQTNYGNRKGIDWQDEVYGGTAVSQMQRFGASGGSENARYNISYTFNNDGNMIPNSGLKTHSFRSSLNSNISKRLTFSSNVTYTQKQTKGVGPYQENGAKMSSLIEYRPTVGIIGDDSDLLKYDEAVLDEEDNIALNPYMQLKTQKRNTKNSALDISGRLGYEILQGLKYNLQVGYGKKTLERHSFFTAESSQAKLGGGPYGSIEQNANESLFGSQTLEYSKNWKTVRFSALAGQELHQVISTRLMAGAHGFPDENFETDQLNLGTIPDLPYSDKESARMASFFSRINLSYQGKYLLTGTFRADGSSKFAKKNKWGFFPSVAAAWRAGEEEFIRQLNVFSNLKVRFSYGLSGNNRINNYLASRMYTPSWTPINNAGATTFLATIGNENLKWETNASLNLGIEMGFFNNRLNVITDLYNVKTHNLLLQSNLPYTSGFESCMRNMGATRNQGLEIAISSVNIQNKKFQWSTDFNVSFNRMKVLQLANSDAWNIRSNSGGLNTVDYIIEVGKPLGLMYGYVSDGLYQANEFTYADGKWKLREGMLQSISDVQPGYKKYKNMNPDKDNKINDDDITLIGNANPDFMGGITNTFSYGNFDLSLFCEFSVGGDIYNANIYRYLRAGKGKNTIRQVYNNRYMTIDEQGNNLLTTGDIDALTRINQGRTFPSQQGSYVPFDSSMVENGSYFRFSNITLGYSIPNLKKTGIEKIRIYGTVSNLGVLTSYSGYDPEVRMNSNQGLTPGIDRGSSPRPISFVIGANLTF